MIMDWLLLLTMKTVKDTGGCGESGRWSYVRYEGEILVDQSGTKLSAIFLEQYLDHLIAGQSR